MYSQQALATIQYTHIVYCIKDASPHLVEELTIPLKEALIF